MPEQLSQNQDTPKEQVKSALKEAKTAAELELKLVKIVADTVEKYPDLVGKCNKAAELARKALQVAEEKRISSLNQAKQEALEDIDKIFNFQITF